MHTAEPYIPEYSLLEFKSITVNPIWNFSPQADDGAATYGVMGLDKTFYAIAVVPLALIRFPSQRSLAPSVMSIRSIRQA